jgi:hypothetical protein
MRKTSRKEKLASRRRADDESKPANQREIVRDVLLSARACGAWLTLREMAKTTRFGQASISAQLRHLRKRKFGRFVIEKRVRVPGARNHRPTDPRWEYRLVGGRCVGNITPWLTTKMLRDAIEAARNGTRESLSARTGAAECTAT